MSWRFVTFHLYEASAVAARGEFHGREVLVCPMDVMAVVPGFEGTQLHLGDGVTVSVIESVYEVRTALEGAIDV